MIANITAEIFRAFLYGVVSLIGGGFLFETGKSFVKTAGSNQFKGKVEALPFFFGLLILGWVLQHLDPLVTAIVYSFPPLTRAGMMVIGSMVVFNHSVNDFTYMDAKSVSTYFMGLILCAWPFL